MFRASPPAVACLEYVDPHAPARSGLHLVEKPVAQPAVVEGVPHQEVQRLVEQSRQAARAEAEAHFASQAEALSAAQQQTIAAVLQRFEQERQAYFARVEQEIVDLALSIARKILQRETELDPSLLAGLVRIAVDRMQAGPGVQIHVVPREAERWRSLIAAKGFEWQVMEDPTLSPGDCIVQTDLGKANFGISSQVREVEASLRQILSRRPEAA